MIMFFDWRMGFLESVLGCVGATLIVTRGYIFEKMRAWFYQLLGENSPFDCPQCTGFWIGVIISITVFGDVIPVALMIGCSTSVVALIIDKYLD